VRQRAWRPLVAADVVNGEDFLRQQDRMARRRHEDWEYNRQKEQRKRDERFAAQQAGPTWLDRTAAQWQAEAQAKQRAKAEARGRQPFNLFWYERVAVVAGGGVALLLLLSEMPGPLGLLLLFGLVAFAVRAHRGRQLATDARRTVGAFIRGDRLRDRPIADPMRPQPGSPQPFGAQPYPGQPYPVSQVPPGAHPFPQGFVQPHPGGYPSHGHPGQAHHPVQPQFGPPPDPQPGPYRSF
jgi:hypothetical protein